MSNPAINSVDQAIAEANKIAAASAAAPSTAVAIQQPAAQTVAAYIPTKAPTLDDLQAGAMNVDGYLKVKEFGLLVDAKPNLLESVKVSIDLTEVMAFTGVRFGNPPIYMKTYDAVTCASGGTWAEALSKANRVDATARPYMGADIPMTLLEDAKDAKGAIVAPAGMRLGHSTSITNRAALAAFLKDVEKAGLKGQTVEATIGFKKGINQKGQTWGLLTFALAAPAAAATV